MYRKHIPSAARVCDPPAFAITSKADLWRAKLKPHSEFIERLAMYFLPIAFWFPMTIWLLFLVEWIHGSKFDFVGAFACTLILMSIGTAMIMHDIQRFSG